MQDEFRSKFPQWIDDPKGEYTLCLSNDIDSLLSCCLLSEIKDWQVNHFYSFSALHTADKMDGRKAIGVDIALTQGRCFDNHVTLVKSNNKPNPLAANPNNVFGINAGSRDSYTRKYAMSTALLIYSFYGLPLPKSEEGKMLLLTIDTGHQGHWRFPRVHDAWLKRLELEELGEVLNRHERKEFDDLLLQHNLHKHISVQDGKLVNDIDLAGASKLLDVDLSIENRRFDFTKIGEFATHWLDNAGSVCLTNKRVFSLACTSLTRVCLSTPKTRK